MKPTRTAILREARKIARRHDWCEPARVAECRGCLCRKEARAKLRKKAR